MQVWWAIKLVALKGRSIINFHLERLPHNGEGGEHIVDELLGVFSSWCGSPGEMGIGVNTDEYKFLSTEWLDMDDISLLEGNGVKASGIDAQLLCSRSVD